MQSVYKFFLIGLHLFLALGALYGGGAMLFSPDGALLQIPLEWLRDSPFQTYLIPGLLLLTFGAGMPLLSLYGIFTRRNLPWAESINLLRGRMPWYRTFSLYTGVGMQIWIAVQQLMTAYFVLQPVIVLVAVGILVFTLLCHNVQRD